MRLVPSCIILTSDNGFHESILDQRICNSINVMAGGLIRDGSWHPLIVSNAACCFARVYSVHLQVGHMVTQGLCMLSMLQFETLGQR